MSPVTNTTFMVALLNYEDKFVHEQTDGSTNKILTGWPVVMGGRGSI